ALDRERAVAEAGSADDADAGRRGGSHGRDRLPAEPQMTGSRGLRSWLTTTDHKRIGLLYFYTAFAFFLVGGLEALLIRAQLARPNGTVVGAETYNQLFTMHGTTMIFLALMPLSAAFFNYIVPLQIGARDPAFPVLTVALVFLAFDRFFGAPFYLPQAGATPLLWQHLFWLFGHPEVYILILPAMGIVSEVLPTFSRKPLFGYTVVVYSGVLI